MNTEMLPARYLPLRVAEKVLFIGKAVQLLQHPVEAPRVSGTCTWDVATRRRAVLRAHAW